MVKTNKWVLYFHKNPKTLEVFYVGIGINGRYKEIKTNRNKHYINYIAKNGNPLIEIILKNLSLEQACYWETYYIALYGRIGYESWGILVNKSEGGEVGARGIKHTQQWKDNHSKTMVIISQTEKFKTRTSEVHKGKVVSKETINKIFEKRKLKKDETSLKLKQTFSIPEIKEKRGKSISKGRKRKIVQKDIKNNIIKVWDCTKDIENSLNIKEGAIRNCCRNKQKLAGGFIWVYEDGKTWKHKKFTSKPSKRKIPITQFDLNGLFIKDWDSATTAYLELGIKNGDISSCCKGKQKTAGGFIWKYKINHDVIIED